MSNVRKFKVGDRVRNRYCIPGHSEGKPRTWIRTTIAEPFPVFFSHVDYPSELRPETAQGPFYSAGSEWFETPERAAFCEWRAAGLRERGWTVTVERVFR